MLCCDLNVSPLCRCPQVSGFTVTTRRWRFAVWRKCATLRPIFSSIPRGLPRYCTSRCDADLYNLGLHLWKCSLMSFNNHFERLHLLEKKIAMVVRLKSKWTAEEKQKGYQRNQKPFHKWGHRFLSLWDQHIYGLWPEDCGSGSCWTPSCVSVILRRLETTRRYPETAFYIKRRHGFWSI